MNNGGSRKREFSVTRLSYSRDTHSRIQRSQKSHSPQPVKKEKKETLMCDNCFNHKISSEKKNLLMKPQDQKVGWTILENKNPKRAEAYQNQIQKTLEYNLLKMQQNQRKRQKEKQLTNEGNNRISYQQIEKVRQLNEQKRIKLRQQLQLQIATAKERRKKQNQQIRQNSPFLLIENKQPLKKHQQIEKYKQTLLQQMKDQKLKKQMENQIKQSGCGSALSFLEEADQKMQAVLRNQDLNKQNLREQLKRKKQQEGYQKNEIYRARREEENIRVEDERRKREEAKKAEQKRKEMINGYLTDLRKQIQQNQFKRKGQNDRFSTDVGGSLLLPDNRKECEMVECGCCSKGFPKTFLSPYLPQTKS